MIIKKSKWEFLRSFLRRVSRTALCRQMLFNNTGLSYIRDKFNIIVRYIQIEHQFDLSLLICISIFVISLMH